MSSEEMRSRIAAIAFHAGEEFDDGERRHFAIADRVLALMLPMVEELALIKLVNLDPSPVYRERAILLSGLARLTDAVLAKNMEDEGGFAWILCMQPWKGLQMTWHIADTDLDLFGDLPRIGPMDWDGHTTEEKYDRYLQWMKWVAPTELVIG